MLKKIVVCVFFVVFASFLQASVDCNSIKPDWKLAGTNCSIDPYYYVIDLSSTQSLECQCGEPAHNYTRSGSATEYYNSLGCDDCDCEYGCKEPIYSCDGSTPDCWLEFGEGCGDTHPRFYCGICFDCESSYDSCSSTGGWDDKVFTGAYSFVETGSHDGDDWTYSYSKDITVNAIFDKPTDPNCYNKPEVKYSKFDRNVVVRAKDGDRCCEAGGSQTIRIYCSGASHIKNVQYTASDGQLYTVYVEEPGDVDFCDNNNHSSPSVKVTYHPRHNKVEYQQDLEETVEVSCDFYDSAGNECGSGSASVKFTLGCPAPPEKG